jgi:hypothetical protein
LSVDSVKKYVFDKRLPELFEYFNQQDIPLENIKIELDSYNKAKDIVFDNVFKVEQAIIAKDLEGVLQKRDDKEKEKIHIQHKPFLKWLKEKEIITAQEFTFLNVIRNVFSHNQYPQKSSMELFVNEWPEDKLCNQIVAIFNAKINRILEDIKEIKL